MQSKITDLAGFSNKVLEFIRINETQDLKVSLAYEILDNLDSKLIGEIGIDYAALNGYKSTDLIASITDTLQHRKSGGTFREHAKSVVGSLRKHDSNTCSNTQLLIETLNKLV